MLDLFVYVFIGNVPILSQDLRSAVGHRAFLQLAGGRPKAWTQLM